MKLEPNVWFDEVVKTYHLISPHIHHTQLVTCPDLNEELDGMYLFKPESLQITGSFKVRGALSAISRLTKKELKRGVIAYSSAIMLKASLMQPKFLILLQLWLCPKMLRQERLLTLKLWVQK